MLKRILSVSLLVLSMGLAYANGGTYVTPAQHPFFIFLGGGYSFSRDTGIKNPNPNLWASASQGYNSDLGDSEFYSGGLGFVLNQLLSISLEVTRRPSYEYSKFQTSPTLVPGGLGPRTREFKFDNTSIMLDALFYGAGFPHHPLVWDISKSVSLQPFVGIGAGISYNTVSDFHTVLANTNQVVSVGNENTESAFSWQLEAGADFKIQQHSRIDIGYRYFDGGNFTGPNYIYALNNDPAGSTTVPAWKGDFRAHEAFINFYYIFA